MKFHQNVSNTECFAYLLIIALNILSMMLLASVILSQYYHLDAVTLFFCLPARKDFFYLALHNTSES